MPQSLANIYIHLVFSTKNREPLILPPYEKELHKYITHVCNEIGCSALAVSGYTDHIHVLCRLSRQMTIANLVSKIKAHSSRWMKTKSEELAHFYWQNGYGAFSISHGHVEAVKKYVLNQQKHHKEQSFKEEYIHLLEKHKLSYDEKYLWE